jgi:hypothetical protein
MKKIEIETQKEWIKLLLDGAKGGSNDSNGNLIVYRNNEFLYADGDICELKYHTSGLYIIQKEFKLSDFLKENGCYDEFRENFDKEYDPNSFKNNVTELFLSAFPWGISKQGFDYWCSIFIKWRKIEYRVNDMLWLLEEPTEFNYNKIIQPNNVVRCETEEQANELLRWANSKGLTWSSGKNYLSENQWEFYGKDTCYCLKDGLFSDKDYYENEGYRVLSFKEVKYIRRLTNEKNKKNNE